MKKGRQTSLANGDAMSSKEDFQAWIGRRVQSEDVLTEGLFRRFAATFDLADEKRAVGQPAPPLIHFCLAPNAFPASRLGEDGHERRGEFLPPIPLHRRMWAGSRIEFRGALRVGETVCRVTEIESVSTKEGKRGPLCFVGLKHTIQVGDEVRIIEHQDLVYLDTIKRHGEAHCGADQLLDEEIMLGEATLFRYSAITFNSHRIHYDRDYARATEGYPDLVVHGPLQATLLISYATKLAGRPPNRFSFKAVSPLYVGNPITLRAVQREGATRLECVKRDGQATTYADAMWS